MNLDQTSYYKSKADEEQWLRVGGIAAILLALGYLVIFPLYFQVGAPPSDGHAWFKYLRGKTSGGQLWLSLF
ncbi:MAG TPA: hypothetical protein VH351_10205 [Bryobacteraceae bacterium]|jgi:hypothetical protein|nr:hypothetical protein [Bryobacteraceae bacterium]